MLLRLAWSSRDFVLSCRISDRTHGAIMCEKAGCFVPTAAEHVRSNCSFQLFWARWSQNRTLSLIESEKLLPLWRIWTHRDKKWQEDVQLGDNFFPLCFLVVIILTFAQFRSVGAHATSNSLGGIESSEVKRAGKPSARPTHEKYRKYKLDASS